MDGGRGRFILGGCPYAVQVGISMSNEFKGPETLDFHVEKGEEIAQSITHKSHRHLSRPETRNHTSDTYRLCMYDRLELSVQV